MIRFAKFEIFSVFNLNFLDLVFSPKGMAVSNIQTVESMMDSS